MNLPKFTKLPGAVAIDLDGTLLNSKTQLSERNRAALEKCIERGIPVIIATSRSERGTRRVIGNDLSDACSLVMANGAMPRAEFHYQASSGRQYQQTSQQILLNSRLRRNLLSASRLK